MNGTTTTIDPPTVTNDDLTREESALREAYDALFTTSEVGNRSAIANERVKQALVGVTQTLLHAKEQHDVNEIYGSGREATNGLIRALTTAASAIEATVEVATRYRQHARGLNAAFVQLERAHTDADLRPDNVRVIRVLQEAIRVLTSVLNAVALGQDIPADTLRNIEIVEQSMERMIGVKLDVLELNPHAQTAAGSPASVQAFVAARRDFPLSPMASTPASVLGALSRSDFPAAEDSVPTAEAPIGVPPTASSSSYQPADSAVSEDDLREGTILNLQPPPPGKFDDMEKRRERSERERDPKRRGQMKRRTFHGAPNHPPSPPHSEPTSESPSEHSENNDDARAPRRPRKRPDRHPTGRVVEAVDMDESEPPILHRPAAVQAEAEYRTVVAALGRNFPYLNHLQPGHLNLRTDAEGRRFVRIDVIEFESPMVRQRINERGETETVQVEQWEEFYVDGGPGRPGGAHKKIRCCVM